MSDEASAEAGAADHGDAAAVASRSAQLLAAGTALAAASARLAQLGWMRGTAGNLSVVLRREPLCLAVTASGIDKGALTAADVVAVDGAGGAIDPAETRRPSAEAALHA